MARRVDPRIVNTFLDAHVLDRLGGLEDAVVEELLETGLDRGVVLHLPHSVKAEIEHPNTPADVKRRATSLIYSVPVQLTEGERKLHQKVRSIIQGNAKPGKHNADAFHLVESAKYGGGYFLTNDTRLLRKASEVAELLQIQILTPTEFLSILAEFERSGR